MTSSKYDEFSLHLVPYNLTNMGVKEPAVLTSPMLRPTNGLEEKTRHTLGAISECKRGRHLQSYLYELKDLSNHVECLSILESLDAPGILLAAMIRAKSCSKVQEIGCLLLESWMSKSFTLHRLIIATPEVIRHVVQMMKEHADVGSLQVAVMKAIIQIAENDNAKTYLLDPVNDVFSDIIVAMSAFTRSVQVQATACKALKALLLNKSQRQLELVTNEEHRLITDAIWKHPKSKEVMTSACNLFSLLLNADGNVHTFIGENVHLMLVQHIKYFTTDPEVLCCMLDVIHMFVDHENVYAQLIEAKIDHMLLEVLIPFLDRSKLQFYGLRLFNKLAAFIMSDDVYKQEKEWLKVMSLVMTKHREQIQLQHLCCVGICILLEYRPSLQDLIGEHIQVASKIDPVHTLCLGTILMHAKDENTFSAACDAIYWMSADNPRIQELLLEKNTHMAILDGMRLHQARAKPQLSGCRAIRGLCLFSMKHKTQVANYDRTLLGLMSIFGKFPNDASLQLEAISTIGCLADIELVRNQCLIEKVHIKVVDCMEKQMDDELIQESSLETLAVLAAAEGGAHLLNGANTITQVVETMKNFKQTCVIQKKGLMLLQLLANKDYVCEHDACSSLAQVIIAAMQEFPASSNIQCEGCVAIQVWCEQGEEISKEFVDLGAHELLFTIIDRYGSRCELYELASEALYMLACVMNYKSQMLLSACAKGMLSGVECLLELGADVNTGQGVDTPLCHACKYEDVDMAKIILQQGVTDINTALQMSLKQQSHKIVGVLLKEIGRDTRDKEAGTIVWSGIGLGNLHPDWLIPSFFGQQMQTGDSDSDGKQLAKSVKCSEEKRLRRASLSSDNNVSKLPMRYNWSLNVMSTENKENEASCEMPKVDRRKSIIDIVTFTGSNFIKIISPKKKDNLEPFQRSSSERAPSKSLILESTLHQFASCPSDLEEHRLTSLSGSDVPCSPLDPRLKAVSELPTITATPPVSSSPWGRRRLMRSSSVTSLDSPFSNNSPVSSTRTSCRSSRRGSLQLLSQPNFGSDSSASAIDMETSENDPFCADSAVSDSASEQDFVPILRRRISSYSIGSPFTRKPASYKRAKSWTDLYQEKYDKGCVRVLDISANGITSLSDVMTGGQAFLQGFTMMENLDLSHNNLLNIPDGLFKFMPNLKQFTLHHNNLEKIPFEIFNFCKKLVELDISDNKIDDIEAVPSVVSLSLQLLKISNNMISSFPVWIAEYLPGLEKLFLDGNKIRMLPECPLKLKRLKTLNLSRNYLRHIPEQFLTACNILEELIVVCNELEFLPSEEIASSLPRLTTVKLSHNQISDKETNGIPKMLLELPSLRNLDLSHNCISCFHAPDTWKTPYLKELLLAHNEISELILVPGAKVWSVTLERLVVSHNQLKEIPKEIGMLSCLTSLDVSNNPLISSIPDELGRLSKLWELPLSGLKLDLDEGILRGRTKDLIGYLHEKLKRSESHYRMKMMIVGFGQRGKSSLLQALKRERHHTESQPTVGIAVSDWKFDGRNRQQKMVKYTLNTWDLAGQEQFYSSHQCFLSPRTLYLVIYNVSAGVEEISTLSPWLLNIQARAPDCPVIIVGTHKDRLPKDGRSAHIKEMRNNIMELLRKPGHSVQVRGMIEVCCTRDNSDIEKLRTIILNTVNDFQTKGQYVMGQKIPASYKKLEECISNMAKNKKTFPVISHKVLMKIKDNAKLDLDEDELKQAVRFLHEAGVMLHYEDCTLQLNDLYFIDPGWLCRMMAQVITVREINPFISEQGVLKRSDVPLLFRGKRVGEDVKYTFPVSLIPQYLRLLEKFEIALPKNDEELLITSRLSDVRPTIEMPYPNKTSLICNDIEVWFVERQYVLSYTPLGFWSRLITRLLGHCQSDRALGVHCCPPNTTQYWKEGVFAFWSNDDYFTVSTLEDNVNIIMLKVPATSMGIRIFGNLIDCVDNLIDEWYPGLCLRDPEGQELVTRIIPCNRCQGNQRHMFTFEELLTESESALDVQCPNHTETVSLQHIAPDLVLADLEAHFQLDIDELTLIESPEYLLGEGGYGAVYKAEYKDQNVAVKVFSVKADIHPHKLLRQEVAIFRSIKHRSLVSMIGVSIQPRQIAMELAPLGSLGSQLKHGRVSSRSLQHKIALQVAEALEYLHSQGIIYRDMKPDNVLMYSLSPRALVIAKLSDYGISQIAAPYGLSSQEGTIGYRAPEVARGEPYLYQADIYSYGITLFEIVTGGRHPLFDLEFRSQLDEAIMCGRPIENITSVKGVEPWPDMQELIDLCLQLVPEHRPSSCDIVNCLQSAEFLGLRGSFPVSSGLTVECSTIRTLRNGDVEVWMGSGDRDCVQLSWLTVTSDRQLIQGTLIKDSRILCMEAIEDRAILIGTQSGSLWVYDACTRAPMFSKPLRLPDSVLCIRHFRGTQGMDIVLIGLANGAILKFETNNLILDGEAESHPIDVGSEQPVKCIQYYCNRFYVSSGSFVYRLSMHMQVEREWDISPDRFVVISNFVMSKTVYISVYDSHEVIMRDRSRWTPRGKINIAEALGHFDYEIQNTTDARVTSMVLQNNKQNGSALWVGTGGGHVVLIDASTHLPLMVLRRHCDAVRTICTTQQKGRGFSDVLTGGMGFIRRPSYEADVFDAPYGYVLLWEGDVLQHAKQMEDYTRKRKKLL